MFISHSLLGPGGQLEVPGQLSHVGGLGLAPVAPGDLVPPLVVVVQDDVHNNVYPMPINAHQKDEVFVGRLRRDESQANTLNMWIVADNLRKGAATNAVQIAEFLTANNLVF